MATHWTLGCDAADPHRIAGFWASALGYVARAGAEHDGKPLSQWVEQAILNEVGRTDVGLIEEWERALSYDDQAVLAAFATADRLADLDR